MGKVKIKDLSINDINKVVDVLWKDSDNDYIQRKMNFGEEYDDFCKRKGHCKKTADIAMNILDKYGKDFEEYRNILNFACLIHDIRKIKIDCGHGKAGKEFFEDNVDYVLSEVLDDKTQLNNKDKKIIEKIIRNHSGKTKNNEEKFLKEVKRFTELKNENEDILTLILFIRIADKVSKYPDKSKESVLKKAEEQTESLIEVNEKLRNIRKKIIDNIL